MEKCFTIETRVNLFDDIRKYFTEDIEKQSRLFRIVWKLIQTTNRTQSKLNTYLQHTYQIDKRTANTLIQTAKGRLKALKELKLLEISNLKTKISTIEKQIIVLKDKVNAMKPKVRDNKATEKQLSTYRWIKHSLWHKKQKFNRLNQKLLTYDKSNNSHILPICWGGKQMFKAQYHLEDNGFNSHEGWLNAYRRKRDSQVNFVGTATEPKGNQNCQLNYDKDTGYFSLRIRKDIELMESSNDKFFTVENLHFKHHRDVLIAIMEERETPFTFRVLRRGRKWYIQVIFTWGVPDIDEKSSVRYGTYGLDYNDGFISIAETDTYGNLINVEHVPLKYHGTGNKAKTEIQQVVCKIATKAKENDKTLVVEDLNFKKTKAKTTKRANKTYNKMIHAFDYSRYKKCLENACHRLEVPFILVNPAYTSQIGMEKYGSLTC